jgi:hypothetical protein
MSTPTVHSNIIIQTLKFYLTIFSFILTLTSSYLRKKMKKNIKKLLITSIVNVNTEKSFSQIKKEHQQSIPEKDTCLNIIFNL